MRDGRVTEQGRHPDLMALGGQYAELYKLQASQYDTNEPAWPAPRRRTGKRGRSC